MIIYYNPRCSKCRDALRLLEANNCEIEIREYLKTPPTKKELKELLKKLKLKPFDLVRTSEPLYVRKFADKQLTNEQWITALVKNPVLIERPIVINEETAIIGRPPVLVLDLLKK